MTARPVIPSPANLALLTNEEFVAQWRVLVGEPPAAMLPDRAEMIRLLVGSVTPAQPPSNLHWPSEPNPRDLRTR